MKYGFVATDADHDRVDLARVEGKRETLEDLRPANHRMEVIDLEHHFDFLARCLITASSAFSSAV